MQVALPCRARVAASVGYLNQTRSMETSFEGIRVFIAVQIFTSDEKVYVPKNVNVVFDSERKTTKGLNTLASVVGVIDSLCIS